MSEVLLGERDGERGDVDPGYGDMPEGGEGAGQVRVEKEGYAACSCTEI